MFNLRGSKDLLAKFEEYGIDIADTPIELIRAYLHKWGYFGKVDGRTLFPLKNVEYDLDRDTMNFYNHVREAGPFGFGTEIADSESFEYPNYDMDMQEWYSQQLEHDTADILEYPVNVMVRVQPIEY